MKRQLDPDFGSKHHRPHQAHIDDLVEEAHGPESRPSRTGASQTTADDDTVYLGDVYWEDDRPPPRTPATAVRPAPPRAIYDPLALPSDTNERPDPRPDSIPPVLQP